MCVSFIRWLGLRRGHLPGASPLFRGDLTLLIATSSGCSCFEHDVAQTHQFLAANDKTMLVPRHY